MHYGDVFEVNEALAFLTWLKEEHGYDPKAIRVTPYNHNFLVNCAGGHAVSSPGLIELFCETDASIPYKMRIGRKALRRLLGEK